MFLMSHVIPHVPDIDEHVRKKDLERVFMRYGPLKEIWLASYAPFYAFVVYRNRCPILLSIALWQSGQT